jgi:hypothetical protein
MGKRILIILSLLSVWALISVACTINLPVNVSGGGVGETRTIDIDENWPDDDQTELNLEMGAGELSLSGGSDSLAEGSIRYNIESWKPEVLHEGSRITIRQIIDTIDLTPKNNTTNEWDLQLGSRPLELNIKAGAYTGDFDFSGLALTGLDIKDGASSVDVRFDEPNPERMARFEYTTGASDLEIWGLGNANVEYFKFVGGAGKAVFDFSGQLQDDMRVVLEGGAGDVTIIVPEGTNAVFSSSGNLLNIQNEGWSLDGSSYSLSGSGPQIEIRANMSVGNIRLAVD